MGGSKSDDFDKTQHKALGRSRKRLCAVMMSLRSSESGQRLRE